MWQDEKYSANIYRKERNKASFGALVHKSISGLVSQRWSQQQCLMLSKAKQHVRKQVNIT